MAESNSRLSAAEVEELKTTLKAQAVPATSLGFTERGSGVLEPAPVVRIPEELLGAELSVCGVKKFMTDERRQFHLPTGDEVVDCAAVAALEIDESPVHVHMVTQEIYQILQGTGRMVLGNTVRSVSKGDVITISAGVEHGLSSDDPAQPVRVLLSFTPGLAPKTHPHVRDEKILWNTTKERIEQILEAAKV